MHTVQHILDKKGETVATIEGEATVLEAARRMNELHIGALVVTRHGNVSGIVTERDILNRVVAVELWPARTFVKDIMTAPVACCRRDTAQLECRTVMRRKRIRHLPVVENERLVGIVSIGDVIEDENAEQEETIHYLYTYMYGEYR
jgi:CBS domain-containing protein